MIEGHGDDLWCYEGKVKYNFSTNIHSVFDHAPLMKIIAESPEAVTSYPEPQPLSVEKRLAGIYGYKTEEVLVTNGATEAIYLIAKEFQGGRSAIVSPTFREYQDACKMYGHSVCSISNPSEIPDDCNTVWICNPNNPTGRVIPREYLKGIVKDNPDKVFVIDQAYSDYTSCPVLSSEDIVGSGNIIALGSLTKRFAVPGLRIGYAVAPVKLIERLKRWRMPWSVNGIAIKGANYLLDNIEDYRIEKDNLHSEAVRIAGQLSESGIRVYESDCNFILCELPCGTSALLKEYLVDRAGILIRDASNFEGLGPRHFRIAAQSREENNLLIREIRQWLAV